MELKQKREMLTNRLNAKKPEKMAIISFECFSLGFEYRVVKILNVIYHGFTQYVPLKRYNEKSISRQKER